MKALLSTIAAALALALSSCGTLPSASDSDGTGSLGLRIWVNSALSKSTRATQTTWDSLIVVVSAPDMTPVRQAFKFDALQSAFLDTIAGVPEGDDRVVEAWTATKEGVQVHHGVSAAVSVVAGETTPVALQLSATKGSIYINLADVPTNVDSVFAAFYFGADSLTAKDKRSAIMYLSIDNVPDSTSGILVIRGIDIDGKTIYCDSLELLFRSEQNATMQAQFLAKQGGLALDISIQRPGVTVVSGQMAEQSAPGSEAGPLLITEILYYADGDSDYIEIHNPTATGYAADTLILEVINTSSTTTIRLLNVSISAGGFLVVGDTDAPAAWVDTVSAMDLTTTGRWIVLKSTDGTVLDRVSYTKSDQEWPNCSKYYSIELVTKSTDPVFNNYGSNWQVATTPIAASLYYGTPGM